eukprot:UN32559
MASSSSVCEEKEDRTSRAEEAIFHKVKYNTPIVNSLLPYAQQSSFVKAGTTIPYIESKKKGKATFYRIINGRGWIPDDKTTKEFLKKRKIADVRDDKELQRENACYLLSQPTKKPGEVRSTAELESERIMELYHDLALLRKIDNDTYEKER